jgi:phosphate transport system permease protein
MNSSQRQNRIQAGLSRRRRGDRVFRFAGLAAICIALAFLAVLFGSIFSKGYSAFRQTVVLLEVHIDPGVIDSRGSRDVKSLSRADYGALVKATLRDAFPEVTTRRQKRELYALVSSGAAFELRRRVLEDPSIVGRTLAVWVPASDDVDMIVKGVIPPTAALAVRRLGDLQMAWIDALAESGRIETRFNVPFFTSGDSREPELAGLAAAAIGSLFAMAVCLALAFPLGLTAAVYLEEFAPRNLWSAFIEANINNLAAVPSIVFGLLGLSVLLNFMHLPRSTPLVGGIVLALMTLPTIIIAGRAALKAVPPTIREAALALGASPVQVVFHHVVPAAMPGILTGTIIGMARALGETAPLLMIGMVAFIADVPQAITDPATALPVQVYLWADSPERAFAERTAAAIMVLLGFLLTMNALAVILRQRFEIDV